MTHRTSTLVVVGLLVAAAPLAAQQPQAAATPSPAVIKPKECPPPEGFRAIQHLFDNNAPTLQMYPVIGQNPPKDMFKTFGQDMIPRCALERTYDDIQKFKAEFAQVPVPTEKEKAQPKPENLLKLFKLSVRAFKRFQWCLMLRFSEAKEYNYRGMDVEELKEDVESLYAMGMDAGKRYIEGMGAFLGSFTGLENDAVDARKRLDEDEKRAKPRPAKDIAKDQAKVAAYEKRYKELLELMSSIREARMSYELLSKIHNSQKWSWPASGNPAIALAPLIKELDRLAKMAKK